MLYHSDQPGNVIICPGDVVASTHVEPFHTGKELPEFLLKSGGSGFQGVGILFAQGVKMKPIQQGQQVFREILPCGPQAGARGTRIIDGVAFLRRALRIHPQSHLLSSGLGSGSEPAKLIG